MTTPSTAERIVGTLYGELEDGMVVVTGVNSLVPLAACLLARARHAPRLTILAGGIFVNPSRLVPEFCAGWDLKPEYVADMSDLFAITELGVDAVFYSGLQIDRFGNINMHRIGPAEAPERRGPGIANTSFGHTARQTFLWTERHERRQLRHDVDFYSIVGHQMRGLSRSELGLPNAGPSLLVTADGLFRPDDRGLLAPAGFFGTAAWDDTVQNTGWALPPTPPPLLDEFDREALAQLRSQIDPDGLLRRAE